MDWLWQLFSVEGFMPRAQCVNWETSTLLWRICGDALIALAYFLIPAGIRHYRLSSTRMVNATTLWLFETFIFLCGITHVLDVVLIWYPVYRLDAAARALTALVSVITVIHLVRHVPRAVRRYERLVREYTALKAERDASRDRLPLQLRDNEA